MRRHRPNGEARPDQPDNQTASQTRPTGMVQRLKKGTLTTHTLTFTLTLTLTPHHPSLTLSTLALQVKSRVKSVKSQRHCTSRKAKREST